MLEMKAYGTLKWLVELSPKQKEDIWKITIAKNEDDQLDHDEANNSSDEATNMEHLVSCFVRKDSKALLNPNEDVAVTNPKLSGESCLLSIFGWRLKEVEFSQDKEYNSKEEGITIQCPFCLAIRQVQYVDQGGDSIPFDLVNSHRYYCPYAHGFAYGDGTNSNEDPCWMRVASSLSKCGRKVSS